MPSILDISPRLVSLSPRGRGGEVSRLTEFAKRLRRDTTDAERLLWSRLRASQLSGHKFKRQQPIGNYIVDFVCFDAKLIIELDGGQHADQDEADRSREAWLRSQGFRVIRFWNNDVMHNLDGVLERIMENLASYPPKKKGIVDA